MKKCTKIVSSTLAGALAVGMVPAMALADDDAIELQATVAEDAAAGHIATYSTDAQAESAGTVFTAGTADTFNGECTALVPATVTGLSGKTYQVATWNYYEIAKDGIVDLVVDGKAVKANPLTEAPKYAGNYAVTATVEIGPAAFQTVTKAAGFSIVSAELSGVVAYEVDDAEIDDTTFVWKNKGFWFVSEGTVADNGEINLKLGNKALDLNDYEVKAIYDAKGNEVSRIVDAGTYKVVVEGNVDTFYEGKTASLYLTVDKMDLAESTVAINGIDANGFAVQYADLSVAGVANVDKIAIAGLENNVDMTFSTDDEAATLGNHTVKVELADDAVLPYAANVMGEKTISYDVVKEIRDVAVRYDDSADDNGFAIEGNDDMIIVGDRSKVYFDDKYIVDVFAGTQALKAGEYDIKVERLVDMRKDVWVVSSVAELEAADIQGLFRVSVVVNAAAVDYAFAGASDYLYVGVDNGVIEEATTAWTYKGILDEDNRLGHIVYDGSDVMDAIACSVATDTGVYLAQGTDYTLTIKKEVKGEWVDVDEIVNVGKYMVQVVSEKYRVTKGATLDVVVVAAPALPRLVDTVDCKDDCDATILWNGEVVDPIAGFVTSYGPKGKAIEVPASAYTWKIKDYRAETAGADWVSSKKPGLELPTVIQAAGIYEIEITDADPTDNYNVGDHEGLYLHVTADSVFKDVPSDAWFADEVWLADQLGYMTGYKTGDLFGPYDSIIRGDAALVLFRMAGATAADFNGVSFEDGIFTPFEDVYQGAYYAKAIAWCDWAEIMTGYGDGSEFGPNDKITREQVATALYRYDQKLGVEDNLDVLASALDAYVDGDEVSAWAVEAMEWAVSEGIMGVNTDALNPQDDITRAEFAAMMVRYQPSKLGDEVRQ